MVIPTEDLPLAIRGGRKQGCNRYLMVSEVTFAITSHTNFLMTNESAARLAIKQLVGKDRGSGRPSPSVANLSLKPFVDGPPFRSICSAIMFTDSEFMIFRM